MDQSGFLQASADSVCTRFCKACATVVTLADAVARMLVRSEDKHCFWVVERSAFSLPATDGRAGHSIE